MKNKIYELKRTKEIIFVLAKYGFGDIIETFGIKAPFKKKPKISRSERIRKAIEELGPTFIKLAQALSLRPDLISLDLIKEFEKLQDNVTPLPFSAMKEVLENELECKIEEIFEGKFELLASASIGQVYKAKLISGEYVAVKILKPGIEEKIFADLYILKHFAKMFRDKFLMYGIDLEKILDEFAKSIKKELNFNLEALNLKRFYFNFKNNNSIKVPKLYEKLSSKRVLSMEYINGIKISDKEKLISAGYSLKEITKKGFELICEQIFIHRFFHADPHPGNLMVYQGKIVFLDFGIMGRISEEERKNLVELIYYVIKRQEEKAALYILKLSKIEKDIDISSFQREMADIIASYFYSSLKQIELKSLLDDVLKVMQRYKIFFKEENYLFVKSLVTMEGVGKQLYPNFNAAKEIAPFIKKLYKSTFSVKNIFYKTTEINKNILEFLYNLPIDLNEIIKKIKKGNLKIEFEHVGLEEFEKTIAKSFNRLSISIVIASILIGSSMLLSSHVPPLFKNVSIFGILGFLSAFILGVFLIIEILRNRQ